MGERKAVTRQMSKRYARASKREKTRMLDELCELTDWTSRHAGRALQKVVHGPAERPRRTRDRVHGQDEARCGGPGDGPHLSENRGSADHD
jgi:hypothetical protein